MRFCPNCGNPLGGSPRYCAGCATHVGAENGPASTPPWQASPPAPTASSPPWDVSAQPPAGDPAPLGDMGAAADQAVTGDQVAAAITGNPGASPPGWGAARHGRWSRLSAGHGMTITAMVTTVALLVTGGIATWQAGQIGSHMRAANVSLARHTAGRPRGHARSRAASPSADSPATGSPTTGSPTTGAAVIVAPDVGFQPHVHRVALLLDRYFGAINQHDFQAYSSLFIPAIRVSMRNFGSGYQSTRDSRATLTGLVPTGPQGLAAMVRFVSHQNPAESPDHARCDRWHITLFLKSHGGSYHIRRHQPGFPADTVRACR
jgi:hypothetical protein